MEFQELPHFTQRLYDLLSEDDYQEVQNQLIEWPDKGKLIRGSGGLRKLRVQRPGMGKQGGARIIYYWYRDDNEIFFLDIYAKSDKTDLTKDQVKELRSLVEAFEAVRVRK